MPRLAISLFLFALATAPAQAAWDPQAIAAEDTLEFFTVSPEDGEHWSTVWLVVIDGQVYIRLGSRAAERIEKNTTAPTVKVKVAGQEFDAVTAESAPDMVAPVAAAMKEKYWTDLFVRGMNHPLTMRLAPASQ
ncbi:MAG: hypothetical protein ACRERC_01320 [Candidatus Binatia bacterium]